MNLNEIQWDKLHLQSKAVQFLLAAVVALVIVVAGYFVLFQSQWDEYKQKQEEEVKLKTEFEDKSVQAASLDNLQKELELIEASLDVLLKQLPTSAEIPTLIQEMHQAAAKSNLVMTNVTPGDAVAEKPIQIVIEKPIERLPIAISVSGSYEQLSEFVRDVGRMSRIVTLANINLTSANKSAKDDGSKLTLSATANTYKAMDLSQDAKSASAASQAE